MTRASSPPTRRYVLQATTVACALAATGGRANETWPRPTASAIDLPTTGGIRYIAPDRSGLPFPRVMVSQEGALLEEIDFSGCYVSLQASNITIRNCLFTATAGVAVALDGMDGITNITVETCRFDGEKKDVNAEPMFRVRNGTMFVRGCLFENLPSDAITMVGGTVEHSTFRGSGYKTGAHADAIWVPRTMAPVRIVDNDVDWRKPIGAKVIPNAAFQIVPTTGDIHDVLIERNRCRGGSYTIQVAHHATRLGRFQMDNVVVRDNELSDWLYGPLYPLNKPPDLVFTGNRNLISGALLSGAPQKALQAMPPIGQPDERVTK